MDQTSFELGAAEPEAELQAPAHDGRDPTGFQIGWDHARHGLVPPAELLLQGTPLGQGWRAGKSVLRPSAHPATRPCRLWLALRTTAWRRGIPFEGRQVTPQYLAQIQGERCPVTRARLGGAADAADAAVVERLNPQAGYAAGNLAVLSQQAAHADAGRDRLQVLQLARCAETGGEPILGLDAGAWWRLAVLRSFATPLPFHEALRLPLAVLPPDGVRPVNAPQRLQLLLTLQFTAPGWAGRTRAVAALLPEDAQRHDFNLFVGAYAPRILEAEVCVPRVLEDAWLHERVRRRWESFVLGLGEAGTSTLLECLSGRHLPGMRLMRGAHQPGPSQLQPARGARPPAPLVSGRRSSAPRAASAGAPGR